MLHFNQTILKLKNNEKEMAKNKKTKNSITIFLRRKLKSSNIFVFLFFFIFSAFLWFLNSLNKEYSTTIVIPLKIENTPKNLNLKEESINELIINIYGHGYSLLKVERTKDPITIDFNEKIPQITLHKNASYYGLVYILTSDLHSAISKRFGDNIKIISIQPDTIFFSSIKESTSKKVPIIPNVEYEIQQDYMLNGKPILSEDSIMIYGSRNILDTILNINTKKENLGVIDDNNNNIKLELCSYPTINYQIKSISISFPIEKYTEAFQEVQIKAIDFPENLNPVLNPNTVQVFYKVPLSLYNEIDKNNFEVSVSYLKKKNDIIPIDIKSINNVIEITKTNPIFVKYFLEKNNTND